MSLDPMDYVDWDAYEADVAAAEERERELDEQEEERQRQRAEEFDRMAAEAGQEWAL